eukprot:GHVH01009802.1.p1 GENE.GHVH01009802.1~~GHVH01009802.1.p1  ORF type:complete len:221 (-),score=36.53 GHVH01009802.1:162-824(-)
MAVPNKSILVAETKWIRLEEATVSHPKSGTILPPVSVVSRTTTPEDAEACAVMILPILVKRDSNDKVIELSTIIEKQFRPAAESYTLEFPAGLIDPGEPTSVTAVRELKEETGYHGVVVAEYRSTIADGITGPESLITNIVEVDMNQEINKHPNPDFCGEEDIESYVVPLTCDLLALLTQMATDNDCILYHPLQTFAIGLSFAASVDEQHLYEKILSLAD